ncbi:PX-SNX-like domain protein (macronuclear) [Tetrahymena thermophila SB210]|uniref:PX-SNX-like domain protein n=1 Tax=Tetrahymena thermophila (strain SB210) TaxID=312017 RepID=I7M8Y0_TETTS|nr:PX-SNX-like domain protein [Tetrahymena thermophila SB210]EAS00263.3 PX-SNX-like domain protein [Tetrahymena thermophila SB210]|eukprot:XP_001020508.3 PX-SNX-like domain protein [Tetrahymena thermophila SB210]
MSRIRHSGSGFESQIYQYNANFASDKLKFYEKFYQDEQQMRVQIIAYERQEDLNGKKFIGYIIQVETDQLSYQISKRYSEFKSFKSEIEKQQIQKDVFSEFPRKIIFGNQEPEVLESRKIALNNFIQRLVEIQRESYIPQFYDFLEIYNKYQMNKISIPYQRNQLQNSQIKGMGSQIHDSSDLKEINDMLILLNKHSDEQIQNYRQIEERYGKQKPKLEIKSIKLLLHGNDQLKGLIKIVGQPSSDDNSMKNNHIQCSAGLQILAKLLDFEFNRDAETYIRVFSKETPVQMYQELRLDKHISDLPANNCRQYAFQLLSKYADKNQDKEKQIYKLMSDYFKLSKQSLEEYKKWSQQRQQLTTNQYLQRNQLEIFKQEKDNIFQTDSTDNMALQIDNFLLQDWTDIKKDDTEYKIKTQQRGSQLFKITSYFPTEKENLIDFFVDKQYIWDSRCREYRELKEQDVNDISILPVSYEQYFQSTAQIIFLYKVQRMEDKNNIKIFKQKVDLDQINKSVYQNQKLADWSVYYLFQDYNNSDKPEIRCKVTQIIKHNNDNFFLSEMTGDKNDTIQSLINLMKHIKSKYCKNNTK